MPSKYWALVCNVDDSNLSVVKKEDVWVLHSDGRAEPLNPKNDKDFSKNREYGRKMFVRRLGKEMMVRHFIVALSVDAATLLEMSTNKHKRVKTPKRQSSGPIVEPLDKYKYPDERKAERVEEKKVVLGTKKADGDAILAKYAKTMTDVNVHSSMGHCDVPNNMLTQQEFEPNQPSPAGSGDTDSTITDPAHSSATAGDKDNIQEPKQEDSDESANNMGSTDKLEKEPGTIIIDNSAQGLSVTPEESGKPLGKHLGIITHSSEHKLKKAGSDEGEKPVVLCHTGGSKTDTSSGTGTTTNISELERKVQVLETAQHEYNQNLLDLKGLISDLASKIKTKNDGITKKGCLSRLQKLERNFVDDSPLPPNTFKVKEDVYILLDDLKKVEEANFFTNRVEGLCNLFCCNESEKYSVDPNKAKEGFKIITQKDISIMTKILMHMAWTYKCAIDEPTVKARIVKHTSECRKGGKVKPIKRKQVSAKVDKKSSKKDKKKSKKRNSSSSDSVSSSSSDEAPKKRRKKSSRKIKETSSESSSSSSERRR